MAQSLVVAAIVVAAVIYLAVRYGRYRNKAACTDCCTHLKAKSLGRRPRPN
jgi:hypothetical protein